MADDQVVNAQPLTTDGEMPDVDPSSPKAFLARASRCKTKKRELIKDWEVNVDYRRAKASDLDSDDNRNPVPLDWSMSKAKISSLFSQIPTIIVSGRGIFKKAAPSYQEQLNYRLQKGGLGATMFEALPDLVNAAGICAAIVTFETKTEMRKVPRTPDNLLPMMDRLAISMGLKQREMVDQPHVIDKKFGVNRFSPADLLWDIDFTGSDFDACSWIGNEGRATWAEALSNEWVEEDDKAKVLGDKRTNLDRIGGNDGEDEASRKGEDDVVNYTQIFYWRHLYHPEEKYFKAIHHLIFVDGIDKPVVDEPWKGQEFHEESGKYIGACRFPIRVCTLNYITDEAIPPSDSAMGRPQVKEMNRSREQIMEQRDYAKPIRWADSNRIDSDIMTAIMQGDFQGVIPTQGDGTKALGQIAPSNYPRENFEFDRVIKADLMETWSTGPNQMGTLATGERTAQEASIAQGAFTTRQSQERARVAEFVVGIADVMGGYICLFDDDYLMPELAPKTQGPDGQPMPLPATWDRKVLSHELVFSIRVDSTVLLDSNQRLDRAMRLLNIAGKSNYIQVEELLRDIVSLSGYDPDALVHQPPPPKPEPPNLSFRFSGAQDLINPIALAMLLKNDMGPNPEQLSAAIEMIKKSILTAPAAMVQSVAQPGDDKPNPAGPMADDRPDWQSTDRINSRRDASQD